MNHDWVGLFHNRFQHANSPGKLQEQAGALQAFLETYCLKLSGRLDSSHGCTSSRQPEKPGGAFLSLFLSLSFKPVAV